VGEAQQRGKGTTTKTIKRKKVTKGHRTEELWGENRFPHLTPGILHERRRYGPENEYKKKLGEKENTPNTYHD